MYRILLKNSVDVDIRLHKTLIAVVHFLLLLLKFRIQDQFHKSKSVSSVSQSNRTKNHRTN
jgi:hypothetical protein